MSRLIAIASLIALISPISCCGFGCSDFSRYVEKPMIDIMSA
ncbi:hypothetical protein [Nostoc sp.]